MTQQQPSSSQSSGALAEEFPGPRRTAGQAAIVICRTRPPACSAKLTRYGLTTRSSPVGTAHQLISQSGTQRLRLSPWL
jgi:hypothetical protein